MRDKRTEYKYRRWKRNGKDCYTWFVITDYWHDVEFTSAVHKISLNVYRMLNMKYQLRNQCIYI